MGGPERDTSLEIAEAKWESGRRYGGCRVRSLQPGLPARIDRIKRTPISRLLRRQVRAGAPPLSSTARRGATRSPFRKPARRCDRERTPRRTRPTRLRSVLQFYLRGLKRDVELTRLHALVEGPLGAAGLAGHGRIAYAASRGSSPGLAECDVSHASRPARGMRIAESRPAPSLTAGISPARTRRRTVSSEQASTSATSRTVR
jgi:hypothetical protein